MSQSFEDRHDRARRLLVEFMAQGGTISDSQALRHLCELHEDVAPQIHAHAASLLGEDFLPQDLDSESKRALEVQRRELMTRDDVPRRLIVKGVIGRGGMSVVRSAWDRDLDRDVALKHPAAPQEIDEAFPASSQTPDYEVSVSMRRFLDEAHLTASLEHPAIVPVHTIGADQSGRPYFTMKLVKGVTFESIARWARESREGWTLNSALEVLLRITDALAYAHSCHIIHRDVKPRNIMVGEFGSAYLMDWGLARRMGDDWSASQAAAGSDAIARTTPEPSTALTRARGVVGTVPFMSPEQAAGATVNELTDVYSIGAVLYFLLSGKEPYPPGTLPNTVVTEAPPPLSEVVGTHQSSELVELCNTAMARQPEHRFDSAVEVARSLRDYLEDASEDRQAAIRQARRARLQAQRLRDVLGRRAPSVAKGKEVTVREAIEDLASSINADNHPTPDDEAYDRETLGCLFRELGELARAEEHLGKACQLYTDEADRLGCAVEFGLVLDRLRRTETYEHMKTNRERLLASVGPAHSYSIRQAYLLAEHVRRVRGDLAEAEALYQAVISQRESQTGGRYDLQLVEARLGLGLCMLQRGLTDQALEALESCHRQLEENESESFPLTIYAAIDLAKALDMAGELTRAEAYLAKAVSMLGRVMGPEHPDTLLAKNNLAKVWIRGDRLAEAEDLLTETLSCLENGDVNERDTTRMFVMANLGLAKSLNKAPLEGEKLLRDVLRLTERSLDAHHPYTALFRLCLATSLEAQGRVEEATSELQEVVAAQSPTHGSVSRQFREAATRLDAHLEDLGRAAERDRLRSSIGHSLQGVGLHEEAVDWLVRASAGLAARLGEDHPATLDIEAAIQTSRDARALHQDPEESRRSP